MQRNSYLNEEKSIVISLMNATTNTVGKTMLQNIMFTAASFVTVTIFIIVLLQQFLWNFLDRRAYSAVHCRIVEVRGHYAR